MVKKRGYLPRRGRLALLFFLLLSPAIHGQQKPICDPDNAGLNLPEGFCALIVADKVGPARHLTVAPNGDVFVALQITDEFPGGILLLRDTTGDGAADVKRHFGRGEGSDVAFHDAYLYFSTDEAVMRYPWRTDDLTPSGEAEPIIQKLPAARGHRAKSMAFGPKGALYVNIGSASNACQRQDRAPRSPGKEPCEELETRAGIWHFNIDRPRQHQQDGSRFATGLRNTVALAIRPQDGKLYGVVHGRDQLTLWPQHFDAVENAEKPSEEFVRIMQGSDFGWPYCYHDPALSQKVLAPEYGGDGKKIGRCQGKQAPLLAFPAHWAPNGLLFYSGDQFPARYQGGAFIAFHGSWNRAPLPQKGYNVVFVPFEAEEPSGNWEVFADGFAGEKWDPDAAEHRPVGIAEGPDGSLYVSEDQQGRIYRILYRPDQ